MRNFLITCLAFLIAVFPLILLLLAFIYLDSISLYFGIPVTWTYFLFGFLVGVNKKSLNREYREYWVSVWDTATERI